MALKPIDNHVLHALVQPEVRDFPPTPREIAERSGLSITTVNGSLRRLKDEGKVREIGVSGRARTWAVTS